MHMGIVLPIVLHSLSDNPIRTLCYGLMGKETAFDVPTSLCHQRRPSALTLGALL